MSEILGRLDRIIEAQGPDALWVACRNEIAACYDRIDELHLLLRDARSAYENGAK